MSNSHFSRYTAVSIRYIPSCLQNKIKKEQYTGTQIFIEQTNCFVFYCSYMFRLIIKPHSTTDVPLLAVGSVSLKHGSQDIVTL